MPATMSLKQIMEKVYKYLEGLPDVILASFGSLPIAFIMIVWGPSGNGKTNFLMQFLKALIPFGKVLYISLEEGHEASIKRTLALHFTQEHYGSIIVGNHLISFEELRTRLRKKKSPRFIIIDSLQYWNITVEQYKLLKEEFAKKTFIFISHSAGKMPDGRCADKIRYDAGIKVRIEGYVAYPVSRYGGNKPYVIWEEGAKGYYGPQKFKKITAKPKVKA